MRARVLGALLAVATLAVVLTAAAMAQTPTATATATATASPTPTPTATPTATPTPTPTPDPKEEERAKLRKRKIVRRVYRDYRDDGRIDNCKHSRKALRLTLKSISPQFDADFPDFRPAVKAAIKDWDKKRCDAKPTPTATPSPTSTPAPTATSAPTTTTTTTPPPPPTSSSGTLPPRGSHSGGSITPPPPSSTVAPPPSENDVTPVQPTPTATPTVTATPPAEAQLVVTRPRPEDPNLAIPGLLLAAALLGLAGAAGTALYARRTGRLQGWGHAWREASYRASGAWGDFSDWLRLGR